MENKVVFIIPGYNESQNLSRYKKVAKFFKEKGMKVVPVNIKWKYRVMSDYLKQFKEIFDKNRGSQNYFFGFSFGAFIAFDSAVELKPKAIFLCSLSPYFLEDFNVFPKSWLKGDKKRTADMKNFSFDKMVGQVKSEIYAFVGEKEHKILIDRAKKLKNKNRRCSLKVIKGAKHYLSEKYLEEVEKMLRKSN